MKICGRISEKEAIEKGWKFIGVSRENERIYYSPNKKMRFAIYPNTWEAFITNNNLILKLLDKFAKKVTRD